MKRLSKLTFYAISFVLFFSCQNEEPIQDTNPFEHISDSEVTKILQKVFDKAGGLNRWNDLKSINFKKHFALFDSIGNIETDVIQTHNYSFQPKNKIKISWTDFDENSHEILYENDKIIKNKNGAIDTQAKQTSLKNTILSSTFVIGLPFKLLDKGVELSYAGKDTLDTGNIVHIIKAVYNPTSHENHSTPDIWWHYFDEKDYHQVGYMVQHADHFSYVKNLTYLTENGFFLTETRKSYRVDSLRNILYLRAEYEYSDYELK